MVSALGVTVARGASLYNAAALVHAGRVHGIVPKEKLPLYNVFYEARTLTHGAPGMSGDVGGVPFGDLVFDLDFGDGRARGVRGPAGLPTARCAAAATRGPSSC